MKKSAREYIISIIENGGRWSSELLQATIQQRYGVMYKCSGIERVCRDDSRIAGIWVQGKRYKDYSLVRHNEQLDLLNL